MKIIEYSSHRSREIADLFYRSVHAIDCSVYSKEQQNAWAPPPVDYVVWEKRLGHTKPYLLLVNDQVAGFIELEPDGHIGCAYVSPLYQRRGVGSALLKHVISTAGQLGIKQLFVEASIIAKPLFEKFGFLIRHENKVVRNSVVLINYSMTKSL